MSFIENMQNKNNDLSKYASKDSDAIKIFGENNSNDIRTQYFRDIDKIIYSLSYTRYMDKTQVFSFNDDDHICKRMIHVQFVSKIARTIGRALGLNEDLIEAASLGHDLGHVPYAHVGEKILNDISIKNNEGYFNHNVQSVRTLLEVENNGRGKNITVQVLDAILCHNGEFVLGKYYPKEKTKEEFLSEYNNSYTKSDISYIPMTLEGCVVRISDLIAYIGRDIEDALRLGIISLDDIPSSIKDTLGSNNKDIVNTIIMDIIENSYDKPYIKLSDNIYNAILELKKFNYNNIYYKANSKEDILRYEKMFNALFDKYKNDIKEENYSSSIFRVYLNNMSDEYKKKNSTARIIIDYIAGMTDDYFFNEYNSLFTD